MWVAGEVFRVRQPRKSEKAARRPATWLVFRIFSILRQAKVVSHTGGAPPESLRPAECHGILFQCFVRGVQRGGVGRSKGRGPTPAPCPKCKLSEQNKR